MKKLLFKIKKDTAVGLKKYDGENIYDLISKINYIVNEESKKFLSCINQILFNEMNIKSSIFDLKNKVQNQPILRDLIEKYSKIEYNYDPEEQINRFLHNIYYHCISLRNKTKPKAFRMQFYSEEEYINA